MSIIVRAFVDVRGVGIIFSVFFAPAKVLFYPWKEEC